MKISDLVKRIGGRELTYEILSYVCDVPITEVFLKYNVSKDEARRVVCVAEEVKKGIPLAYAVGYTWVYGLKFEVDGNVLVPRYDTEILVETVLKKCACNCCDGKHENAEKLSILDMCTGSGCIAIALSKNLINAKITGSDISEQALKVAKRNAKFNGVAENIDFIQSDLFENLDGKKFDIIVSNPPYIKTQEIGMHDATILHEPLIALDGGNDGLDFYKRLASQAKDFLNEKGMLAVEIGFDQGEEVSSLFKQNGFQNIELFKDLAGHDRVVCGIINHV